jgi:hypothetical protein
MSSSIDLLPTQMALVVRRLNTTAEGDSALSFLYTSYAVEALIKLVCLGVYAGVRAASPEDAYRTGFRIVRADGLGEFDIAIRELTTLPLVKVLPPGFRPLIAWLTQRRTRAQDEWFRDLKSDVETLFAELPSDNQQEIHCQSVSDVITAMVRFRNKTKAHGALGDDFFLAVNAPYRRVTDHLIETCPAMSWRWFNLSKTSAGNIRGNELRGLEASALRTQMLSDFRVGSNGVHFAIGESDQLFFVGDLMRSNAECSRFHVINGFYNDQKHIAEFVDYAAGSTLNHNMPAFAKLPPPLPASETQALVELDVQSNLFGNLPQIPGGYVPRLKLEEELRRRLMDENHVIITLHGRGGVGKTSLALAVAQAIAAQENPRFDFILWFSSRDIDLRPNGPGRVAQDVVSVSDVAKAYGRLFSTDGTTEAFAEALRDSTKESESGMLFIFDNFETVKDATKFHEFLDTYARLPNKILITSRQRAFKADFPIEVRGMEFPEASQLMRALSRKLHVEGVVTEDVIRKIYNYSEGHAYVIRVLLGEIAKEGKYVPPSGIMAKRIDIVDAVFERSFNNLTDDGRSVFLLVSNWESPVSELALLAVLSPRGIDAERGIEECERLSLIQTDANAYGQTYFSAPKLGRLFGQRKMRGDPDVLLLQEDLISLRAFGSTDTAQRDASSQDRELERFVRWCSMEAHRDNTKVEYLDRLLESTANFWPRAWLDLARFRITYARDGVEYAFRRCVEELPNETQAWTERWRYAKRTSDWGTYLASLVGAAQSAPESPRLLSEIAGELISYITDHKAEFPTGRRGIYLATVRDRMEKIAQLLTGDDFARLGWLFMLENDLEKAEQYARRGLSTRSASNDYCRRLLDRIEQTRDLF